MTGGLRGEPDPVTTAAESLAAAIAQLVAVSVTTALAGRPCAGTGTAATGSSVLPALLTYGQACQRLGISRSKLYALLRDGTIRSVALGPQVRRIPAAELDRYVATLLAAEGTPA